MIKSFKCKETEKIYHGQKSKKMPPSIQQRALRKLIMLNASLSLNDLRVPPSNRLESLFGDKDGQWSIRINDQYRVCFEWAESDVYNVEIVDYHK